MPPFVGAGRRIVAVAAKQKRVISTTAAGPLTPYQGPKRVYGYFQCVSCGRRWESGNSWANCGQDCRRCNIKVYPYEQRPLEKREDDEDHIDRTKPHPAELCEKCQKLGYPCTQLL